MENTTVDINGPNYYLEPTSKIYRFKRTLILRPILQLISKYVGRNQRFSLLEIGTDSGFLLSFLESKYPNSKFTGLEYDPRLVEMSKSKVKDAVIIQGNAESFDFIDQKFDIIVSLQVIEHLYHPELMLASVRNHLNENGIFIFTTPNLESFGARYMHNKWHGHASNHVSLKSYTNWKLFLQKNGFKSLYCGSTFFTGFPIFNKLPFGLINWGLLFFIGHLRWKHGESYIGVFKIDNHHS